MSIDDLKKAYISALDLDEADIEWATLEYRAIPQWDSIAHMELVAAIEDVFDIMLDTEDVIALSSFSRCVEILAKYGVTFDA